MIFREESDLVCLDENFISIRSLEGLVFIQNAQKIPLISFVFDQSLEFQKAEKILNLFYNFIQLIKYQSRTMIEIIFQKFEQAVSDLKKQLIESDPYEHFEDDESGRFFNIATQAIEEIIQNNSDALDELQQNFKRSYSKQPKRKNLQMFVELVQQKQEDLNEQLLEKFEEVEIEEEESNKDIRAQSASKKNQQVFQKTQEQKNLSFSLDQPLLPQEQRSEEEQIQIYNQAEVEIKVKENNFSHYKQKLEQLEKEEHIHSVTENYSLSQPENIEDSSKMIDNFKIVERKQKTTNKEEKAIYKINRSMTKKHNLKRKKQAENQMMANIQFLKQIKTQKTEKIKKQWKHQSPNRSRKDTLSSIKFERKKKLETLGFYSPQRSIELEQQQMYSGESTSFLPELKKNKKKSQIYKMAPYSIYSVTQKQNQLFFNPMKL